MGLFPAAADAQQGQAFPYSDVHTVLPAGIQAGESREQYQVGFDMINLARAAPYPYSFVGSAWTLSPEHSTYICQDGAEKTSRAFLFVP